MLRKISSDGTAIAYESGGSGPPLVLVHGALSDRRHAFGAVRPLLERRVTVHALDRRGHGDSEDAEGYAPGCEYEDIAAVVAAVPGPVALVGHSFGALCALEAARAGAEISGLVLYEGVPRDGRTISPDGLAERVDELVRARQPDAALDAVLAGVEHHGPPSWRGITAPRAGRMRWRACRCSSASSRSRTSTASCPSATQA